MLLQQILKHAMAQYMHSELEPCMPAAPMDSPADTRLQALKKERTSGQPARGKGRLLERWLGWSMARVKVPRAADRPETLSSSLMADC